MAFGHGLDAKFYFHTLDMTDYLTEVDPALEREMAEYATLGMSWQASLPGLRRVAITLSGLYDATADLNADLAWQEFDGDSERPWAYLPQGDAISGVAYCGELQINKFNPSASASDIVQAPVDTIGSDDAYHCEILHPLGAETVTGEETALDGSAASDYGCGAVLICTAFSGTSLDVKLEDSSDDISYNDLVTFTQLTDVGSEVQTVAAAVGSVDRYVKVSWTIVGSSMTFFVAWQRLTS